MKLVKSEKAEEHLENCLRKLRRKNIPESVYNQIYVPEGCELMHNETGTALGILLRKKIMKKIKLLIMLPGPPREMKPMFLNHALPEIIKHSGPETHSIMFHLAGVPESEAEQKMIPLLEEGLKTAYCAEPGNVRVFLSSENFTLLENKVAEAKKIFGDSVLPADCESPVQHVIKLLTEMKCTLSTAESCTGGLISASFTDIPGASATYKGSMIAYHNECKERMLNVSRETLLCYGAVSAQCSSEMVEGVCDKLETEAGIAVTGIAGPGGGTTEKPVGLVYIAVKFKNKKVITENHFHGNRETVRFRTLSTAVNILRNMIISEKNKEQ
jgi:nicotinamide-nucleotide amidase